MFLAFSTYGWIDRVIVCSCIIPCVVQNPSWSFVENSFYHLEPIWVSIKFSVIVSRKMHATICIEAKDDFFASFLLYSKESSLNVKAFSYTICHSNKETCMISLNSHNLSILLISEKRNLCCLPVFQRLCSIRSENIRPWILRPSSLILIAIISFDINSNILRVTHLLMEERIIKFFLAANIPKLCHLKVVRTHHH